MGKLHVWLKALVGVSSTFGGRSFVGWLFRSIANQQENVYHQHIWMVNKNLCLGNKKMLVIGSQLKAARSLVGVEQQQLADAAGVHVNTIRAMEARGLSEIAGSVTVLRKVQAAMERFGVVFTNGDAPGVKLAEPTDSSSAGRTATKRRPRDDTGFDAIGAFVPA
jgi:transcriptional regulator with XRE-family HTH domain